MTVYSSDGKSHAVKVNIRENDGTEIGYTENTSDNPFVFNVTNPTLWSPENPHLYNITVQLGDDSVSSYTGFRTISKGSVNGIQRPLLNSKFVFQFGTLDQGYWPDGLYVPPTVEAMVWDLKLLKSIGMNMVRKHVSWRNAQSRFVMLTRCR